MSETGPLELIDFLQHMLKVEIHCHCGMPWVNVETALELLEVDRVDHGYTVLENPALARQCAEAGIVFTVVPSNSYYLHTLPPEEWALKHPIRHMPRYGIKIHPNSDDHRFTTSRRRGSGR